MKKAIIYFTSKKRLISTLGADQVQLEKYLTDGEVKLINYSAQSSEIFLVYDQMDLDEFKTQIWFKISHLFKEFAFVYHSLPQPDITDFLLRETKLSQEGTHQETVDEYKYSFYKPLIQIIDNKGITDAEFDEIWRKFQKIAGEENDADQAHKAWLVHITLSKEEQSEKQVIYIDNISESDKEKILSYGISTKSPAEIINNIPTDKSSLVILCEVNIDKDGNPAKRTDCYGIELAKELRRKNFKGNILFVSFKELGFFLQNKGKYKLLSIRRGHSYSQLPNQFHHLLLELSKTPPLDTLSFRDIQLFSTSISGIVQEELHLSKETIDYNKLHKDLLKQVYANYHEPVINILEEYDQIPKYKDAYSFTKLKCEELIEKYGEETSKGGLLSPEYKWSVLWLDDEVSRTYEAGKTIKIIEHLSNERGIKVIKVGSFEEAVEKWNQDRATTQSITVVIADYRLNTITKEGFTIQNTYQGYDFLEKVAKEENTLALFVYSGMPRKFLMETFSYYGKKIRFFSKADFPLEKVSSFNFICDEIIEEGDIAWIGINNQPSSKEWTKTPGRKKKEDKKDSNSENKPLSMNQVYLQLKKYMGYNTWNREWNRITTKNIEAHKEGELVEFDITTSEFPSNAKSQLKALKNILLVRRFTVTILMKAYLDNENLIDTKKKIAEYIHKCSKIKRSFKPKTPDILFNRMALEVTEFPLFLLADEYSYLEYDCNLRFKPKEFIDNYFETLSQLKRVFSKVYNQFPKGFLQCLIDKNGYYNIQQKHVAKTEFEKYFIEEEIKKIFFDSSYQPMIRTASEIKIILYFIYFNLNSSDKKKYQCQLLEFSTLLSEIDSITVQRGENCPKSLATLSDFIEKLPAKTQGELKKEVKELKRKEPIVEEYKRLFSPWENSSLLKRKLGEKEEVYQKRRIQEIDNFRNACINLKAVKPSREVYKIINGCYNSFKKESTEADEFIINKAIYYGIYSWNEQRNEEKRKSKENSQSDYIDNASDNSSGSHDSYSFFRVKTIDETMKYEVFERLKTRFLNKMKNLNVTPSKRVRVLICSDTRSIPEPISFSCDTSKVNSNNPIAIFRLDDYEYIDALSKENINTKSDGEHKFLIIPI